MASGIYLNESVWSSPLVGYNKRQNRRVVDLRRKKRGQIMLLEQQKVGEKHFFLKIIFLYIFYFLA